VVLHHDGRSVYQEDFNMAVNDNYRLTATLLHSSGQEAVFSGFYRAQGGGTGTPNAFALNRGWREDVGSLIDDVLHSSWSGVQVDVVNLNDDQDFNQSGWTITGQLSGTGLPPTVAVGLRSPKQGTGNNRSRHNLPLLNAAALSTAGHMTVEARDSLYFLQQSLGTEIVDDTTQHPYLPITCRLVYSEGVLVSNQLVEVVTGQWFVNTTFGTMKSRQDYSWALAEEPE
jgi:hypothetical protein